MTWGVTRAISDTLHIPVIRVRRRGNLCSTPGRSVVLLGGADAGYWQRAFSTLANISVGEAKAYMARSGMRCALVNSLLCGSWSRAGGRVFYAPACFAAADHHHTLPISQPWQQTLR